MNELAFGFRCALALVFVLSGLVKLVRQEDFTTAVLGYDLLPQRAARVVSRLLPPGELLIGCLFFLGLGLRLVSSVAVLLLVAFSIAITINLLRGREIDCGCAGIAVARRIGWSTVARNAVLGTAAIVTAAAQPNTLALDSLVSPSARESMPNPEAAAIVVIALLGTLTLALVRETLSLMKLARRHSVSMHA